MQPNGLAGTTPDVAAMPRARVLIFIVACEAEAALEVLARLPRRGCDLEADVLLIDDSSRHRTFEVGLSLPSAPPILSGP
jgi:hypothetical protein